LKLRKRKQSRCPECGVFDPIVRKKVTEHSEVNCCKVCNLVFEHWAQTEWVKNQILKRMDDLHV